MRGTSAGVLLAVALGVAGPVAGEPAYRPGEVLVKFRPGAEAGRALARRGARLTQRVAPLGLERLELPAGVTVEAAVAALRRDPSVAYAEPNYLAVKAVTRADDPLFVAGEQWALGAIAAPGAWDFATGGETIVAVLDTGIDYGHPDLFLNLWRNPGEIPGNGIDDDGNGVVDDVYGVRYKYGVVSGDPRDDDAADTHGTHVAGVIGAVGNNRVGVAGVNWRVRLMAVKFLHGSAGLGDVADAAAGIVYAVDHGARVVNLSFTIPASGAVAGEIRALEEALAYADERGVLTVSAAGNTRADLDRTRVYPASTRTPNNLAVAATTREDALAPYSSIGAASVHLAAPGGAYSSSPTGVVSTRGSMGIPDRGPYGYLSGTSTAAPHVAGLAALVWAYRPGLDHHQVKARLLNGVDPLPGLAGKLATGGRINAARSLTLGDRACVFGATPGRVNPGATLIITGANFGPNPGSAALGAAALEVVAWGDRRIEARVPGGAVTGRVRVNGEGADFPVAVNRPPEVRLEVSDGGGVAPVAVTARAVATDPDGTIAAYEWDLGDGELRSRPGVAEAVSVTFSRPGTYTLRVRVQDGEGLTATAAATVEAGAGPSAEARVGCFLRALGY